MTYSWEVMIFKWQKNLQPYDWHCHHQALLDRKNMKFVLGIHWCKMLSSSICTFFNADLNSFDKCPTVSHKRLFCCAGTTPNVKSTLNMLLHSLEKKDGLTSFFLTEKHFVFTQIHWYETPWIHWQLRLWTCLLAQSITNEVDVYQ